MGDKTGIAWTDATWNPLRGCTRVSSGCENCYAEKVAARFSGPGLPYEGLATRGPARWTGKVRLAEKHLDDPLRWRRPRRIFVNSMSDLFHESVPDEWIDRIFAVMALAPQHTFQVLTKRPGRMRSYLSRDLHAHHLLVAIHGMKATFTERVRAISGKQGVYEGPLANVHLGVSVEDQATADERIPLLLETPAAVRFISAEPLLGPIDVGMSSAACQCCVPRIWSSRWLRLRAPLGPDRIFGRLPPWCPENCVADVGVYRASSNNHGALSVQTPGGLLGVRPSEAEALPALDWVIVGGESGPGARPCDVEWLRSLVTQCRESETPIFVKQLGARIRWGKLGGDLGSAMDSRVAGGVTHSKGADPTEWPEDLRVQEFPA